MRTIVLAIPAGVILGLAVAWGMGLLAPTPPHRVRVALLASEDAGLPSVEPPAPANLRSPMPPTESWSPAMEPPAVLPPPTVERFEPPDKGRRDDSDPWYVAAGAAQEGRAWSTDPAYVADLLRSLGQGERESSGGQPAERQVDSGTHPPHGGVRLRAAATVKAPANGEWPLCPLRYVPSTQPRPPRLEERHGAPEVGPVPYYGHVRGDRTLPVPDQTL